MVRRERRFFSGIKVHRFRIPFLLCAPEPHEFTRNLMLQIDIATVGLTGRLGFSVFPSFGGFAADEPNKIIEAGDIEDPRLKKTAQLLHQL